MLSFLIGLSVIFYFVQTSEYMTENFSSSLVYTLSSTGVILEILGFVVFMNIEKKAVMGGGAFTGAEPMVDGRKLNDDEALVVRNLKHEKLAIDFVVLGLILQLVSVWHGFDFI